jgi:hypothetical protein
MEENNPAHINPISDSTSAPGDGKKVRRVLFFIIGIFVVVSLLTLPCLYLYRIKAPHHQDLILAPLTNKIMFVQNPIFWFAGRCYGQKPLVFALEDASAILNANHPGAGLAYLDISGAYGGKLFGHLSHQYGRDVDILYIGRNQKGDLYPQRPSILRIGYRLRYKKQGHCRDLRFDAPANLTLVLALLEQQKAEVEKIFVEPFIKEWLVQEAKNQHLPKKTIQQLNNILRYAGSNAASHTDHMHVRFKLEKMS